MKIQALRSLLDGNVLTRKGAVVHVDEYRGRELIALGYAVHLPEPEEAAAAPLVFRSEDQSADPFAALQSGGRDGEEKSASSSAADQAPKTRTYRKRKAESESSS